MKILRSTANEEVTANWEVYFKKITVVTFNMNAMDKKYEILMVNCICLVSGILDFSKIRRLFKLKNDLGISMNDFEASLLVQKSNVSLRE